MARWQEIADSAPELAEAIRASLDARVHKTIATLRRDGSPRISGIEAFIAEGDLWFGSMWEARKALDLQRDPRFALHSGSADPPEWDGDAKVAGRAEEVGDDRKKSLYETRGEDPPGRFHLFRAEITEAVRISLNDARDKLVIESWAEGREPKRIER
ncbi:MAG: pyridoxamine 5'-phosphate oxidase family protein [Solirubrobacterales bacterium]